MKSNAMIASRISSIRTIVVATICVVALFSLATIHSQSDRVTAPAGVSVQHVTEHKPVFASANSLMAAGRSIPTFPQALRVDLQQSPTENRLISRQVQLCQFRERTMAGVHSQDPIPYYHPWTAARPLPWQVFGHGEFIGPERTKPVEEYHLRPDDQLELIYRFTHRASATPYRFSVGDEIMIESLTAPELNKGDLIQGRGLQIQSDGTVTLPLVGQVPVAGRTVNEIRLDLDERYLRYYTDPAITVTPLKTNTKLAGLRESVDGRYGQGGLVRQATVTPEGTIQLPAIQSVPAHGLTLNELQQEIEERYLENIGAGVEVTVVLVARAPSFVYVLGEVPNPGQYQLQKPTSVMQALSMAGGWNHGGNLREIVIFRRTDDWQLMATKLDLRGALHGKCPVPVDEIWIRDSDVLLVPKSNVLLMDDFIDLVFTRGIYGVIPIGVSLDLSRLSSI
jgi:polysaccharide export outer membrane protein